MKTKRICNKCGSVMEEIKVNSPHDVKAFKCPNWENHPMMTLE